MPNILVVDDSQTFVGEACENLRTHGWSAEGVYDADQAIAAISKAKPDAVVLDRNMPGKSGDDVLRWIRSQPGLSEVCIVVLTAYGEVQSAVDALKNGAFQYLAKPLEDPNQLRSILAAGIAWHKAHATRRELLATFDRTAIFRRVRALLLDALRPDGVHIMFVRPDGSVEDIPDCSQPVSHGRRKFAELIQQGVPLVFEQDGASVEPLQPILPAAKTLMAVPVPGANRSVTGVLDMESNLEHAFDPCWREVLDYLADLIGIATEIERRAAAHFKEKAALEAKREQLDLVYREFRHSISTHIQIVSMQTRELLDADFASLSEATFRRRLNFIHDNSNAVEAVVQDLKAMGAVPPELKPQSIDLAAVLREIVHCMTTADVPISGPDPGLNIQLTADREKLAYCFRCLLRNATEAIEEGRKQCTEPGGALEATVSANASTATIKIRDVGIGFSSDQKELLFQPLYTTKARKGGPGPRDKEATGLDRVIRVLELITAHASKETYQERYDSLGKGMELVVSDGDTISLFARNRPADDQTTIAEFRATALPEIELPGPLVADWPNRGMGLYTVRRIIEQHGGSIVADSDGPCRGATFTITLPLGS